MAASKKRNTALALALQLAVLPLAHATNFTVTGTISVNGNPGTLPAGGTFGNSTYDTVTGAISSGKFTFPPSSTTFHSDSLGADILVNYQLSQTNTSTGEVATDGVAALTVAHMKLQIVSAFANGVVPIPLGTCVFQPIDFDLSGTGSAAGLDLADAAFTIPGVAPTDCGGFGDQINTGVAGSNNSIDIHLAGDFTPPPENDTIFENGFDVTPGFAG